MQAGDCTWPKTAITASWSSMHGGRAGERGDATSVLGQTDFNTGTSNTGGISAATLFAPYSLFYDQAARVLWVADADNDRVLMYGTPSSYSLPAQTRPTMAGCSQPAPPTPREAARARAERCAYGR